MEESVFFSAFDTSETAGASTSGVVSGVTSSSGTVSGVVSGAASSSASGTTSGVFSCSEISESVGVSSRCSCNPSTDSVSGVSIKDSVTDSCVLIVATGPCTAAANVGVTLDTIKVEDNNNAEICFLFINISLSFLFFYTHSIPKKKIALIFTDKYFVCSNSDFPLDYADTNGSAFALRTEYPFSMMT